MKASRLIAMAALAGMSAVGTSAANIMKLRPITEPSLRQLGLGGSRTTASSPNGGRHRAACRGSHA